MMIVQNQEEKWMENGKDRMTTGRRNKARKEVHCHLVLDNKITSIIDKVECIQFNTHKNIASVPSFVKL